MIQLFYDAIALAELRFCKIFKSFSRLLGVSGPILSNTVEALNSSDGTDDRILAEKLSSIYKHLAPVESKEQRMLRELNEAKAKTIKRMQAMKKHQRKADPIKYR